MSVETYLEDITRKANEWGFLLYETYGFPYDKVGWYLKDGYGNVDNEFAKAYTQMYHIFRIPKKDGSYRIIEAPEDTLKIVQREILRTLIYNVAAPSVCHAYIRNASVHTNAMFHINKEMVLQFDIQDFFRNTPIFKVYKILKKIITESMVKYLIQNEPSVISNALDGNLKIKRYIMDNYIISPYSTQISALAWKLSTMLVMTTYSSLTPHMPQGAPTSPALSNFSLPVTDAFFSSPYFLLEDANFSYTRYSDNITMSFDIPDSADRKRMVSFLFSQVNLRVGIDGYKLNRKKTKVGWKNSRKVITGISVSSDHLNVPRSKYRVYRAIVHNIAMKNQPTIKDYMKARGIASWVYSVNPNKMPYFTKKLHIIESKLQTL